MSEVSVSVPQKNSPSFNMLVLQSLPGLLLVIAVAVASFYLAPLLAKIPFFRDYLSLKDFLLAIIIGMIIRNTIGIAPIFQQGLSYSTIMTKTGIVLMGASYSLAGLLAVGFNAVLFICVFLFVSALIMMWLCLRLKMSAPLSACLAAGMSVCGVSATIAMAPAVRAKNEDMAYSIAIVLMFGLIALVVFPIVGRIFELSDTQFGAFVGVGIINSAQVLGAGFAYSNEAGTVAGIYNIGRVLFLPFVILMLAIMVTTHEMKMDQNAEAVKINKLRLIYEKFPLFVLGFLAVVCMNTFGLLSDAEIKVAKNFMAWAFLLGFASIGMTTNLGDLKAAGVQGIILGFGVATIKAVIVLFAVMAFIE